MKRITALKFWAASAIIIMLAGVAFRQSDGSITGQVKDSNGAAVAGATVCRPVYAFAIRSRPAFNAGAMRGRNSKSRSGG